MSGACETKRCNQLSVGPNEYIILVKFYLPVRLENRRGGLGYHFFPSRWVERLGQGLFRHLPAPALGGVLVAVAWVLSQALSGPRANIYFAF